MDISDFQPTSILYYKDRKQLKTFLTQIGPAVSLMPDPRVRAEGGGTGWRPIKITCWRAFLAKRLFFSHRTLLYPHIIPVPYIYIAFPSPDRVSVLFVFLHLHPARAGVRACMLPMNSVATTTMSKNLTAPSISTSHQPCAHVASLAVVVQCCMLGGGTSSALGGARRFRSACTEHESMHAEGT